MRGDDAQIPTHLIVSHGDYETSEGLAAVLNHIARYANTADAIICRQL